MQIFYVFKHLFPVFILSFSISFSIKNANICMKCAKVSKNIPTFAHSNQGKNY